MHFPIILVASLPIIAQAIEAAAVQAKAPYCPEARQGPGSLSWGTWRFADAEWLPSKVS